MNVFSVGDIRTYTSTWKASHRLLPKPVTPELGYFKCDRVSRAVEVPFVKDARLPGAETIVTGGGIPSVLRNLGPRMSSPP